MYKKNNDNYYKADYEEPLDKIEDLAGSTKVTSPKPVEPSNSEEEKEDSTSNSTNDPVLRYWKKRLIYTCVFACIGVLLAIGLTILLVIELV